MKIVIGVITVFVFCISFSNLFAGSQEDLFNACKQMDLEGVKQAVEDGADVNALDATGQNALTSAFFSPEITKYLLEKGCDPNGGNYPALIQACNNYSVEVAGLLLKAGADPNKKGVVDPSNTFRLLIAKEKAKGDDANQAMIDAWSNLLGTMPTSEVSAIQITVQQTNCVPCLKMLIDNGVSMEMGDETTILHTLATFSNTPEARKEMFAKGAPNMEAFGLKVPDWYSNLPDENNGTATEMLDLLLKTGPDVNFVDKNGYTPLNMALNLKKPEVAKGLIKAGADVEKAYEFMSITKYPVTYAAYLGDADIMKMIAEKGVDLGVETWEMDKNTKDYSKGYTPLIIAVMNNHLECAKVLIDNGAEPTEGINGNVNFPEINCNFQVTDKSAIYFAIDNNNADMVQLMMDSFSFWSNHKIELEAPENKWNYEGERCNFLAGGEYLPGMYAKKLGFDELAELLATKGL